MTASAAEVEAAQKAMGCDPYWNTHRLPPRCECIITAHAESRWERGCPVAVAVADAVVAAAQPRIAAELRHMAERTIAETVCCDEYDEFKATGKRPKYPHHICYWGAAHAEALLARADVIEARS